MRKFKSILSLILAGVLLTGTLAILGSCDSGAGSDSDDKKESSKTEEKEGGPDFGSSSKDKDGYDGVWLMELDRAVYISGNDAWFYEYDDEQGKYVAYDAGNEEIDEISFDSSTEKITITGKDENGKPHELVYTFQNKKGDNADFVVELDGEEQMNEPTYRIASSIKNLSVGMDGYDESEMGSEPCFATEDGNYAVVYDSDRITFGKFSSSVWDEDDFSEILISEYALAYIPYTSGCLLCITRDEDNNLKYIGLDYTISGEQLTISGLDQIKMEDEDGNKVAFPSSKLTFKYYGDL